MSLLVLGIESSCDDTAAAVLRSDGAQVEILSNIVMGQTDLHANFGGVVPEIAARAHAERLDYAVEKSLSEANVDLSDLGGIAATAGPGLIGGVLAGLMTGKALAASLGKPFVAVNHLAGHALTPVLTDAAPLPYLMLLVSGGHCQFLIVRGTDHFARLGGTIDDAPGEAFDKVARLIGLGQPGGPAVEKAAKSGDPKRFKLPRPLLDRDDMNFSFSGLKTAVLRARDSVLVEGALRQQDQSDLAASFQQAVADVITAKSTRALKTYLAEAPAEPVFAVAGGVAANGLIRSELEALCAEQGVRFLAPPLSLCTDNAAMIAHVGLLQLQNGNSSDLTTAARPRWPLDQTAAPLVGSGRKGPKA